MSRQDLGQPGHGDARRGAGAREVHALRARARARATGQPRVATLFENAAHQELNEHFAEEAALAGLVRDLRTAIAGERAEATTTYPGYARRAAAVGDRAAARLFREIARDEARHARTFTRALRVLRR